MSHVCCLNTYGSALRVAFPAAWKVGKGIPECDRPVSMLSVTLRCVSLSDAKHLQCRYACCFVGRSRTGDNAVANWRSAESSRPAGTAGRPLCPASSHTHSGAIQLRLSSCVCFCCAGNCHAEQKACTLVRRISIDLVSNKYNCNTGQGLDSWGPCCITMCLLGRVKTACVATPNQRQSFAV